MKILTASQIRAWDRYTIEHEPIESLALMERASEEMGRWMAEHLSAQTPLWFVVGKGNNGGDALAVARMLSRAGFSCRVVLPFGKEELSEEARVNLERLPRGVSRITFSETLLVEEGAVLVDGLLGSALRGAVSGLAAEVIRWMNASRREVIAIDLPSGMTTEFDNGPQRLAVRADVTLTLQFPKLSLLLPEGGERAGRVEVVPIGLSDRFVDAQYTPYHYTVRSDILPFLRPRGKFTHKGTFGHALLVCGSEGMVGAAVLAVGGALRSGCGLVSVHLPREERFPLHANHPSAMISCDPEPFFSCLPTSMERYSAVGVGPGLGTHPRSAEALRKLFRCGKPLLLDADALNLLTIHETLQEELPAGCILTPHPGELQRLIGSWETDFQKMEWVRALSDRFHAVVVVKGANTMVCMPDGTCWFNSTGNAGMAKAGSGDVLCGLITGLLAAGYGAPEAALLGVYLHGASGDRAAAYYGEEGMNSSDLADFVGEEWAELESLRRESSLL